jgi:hypothetical protein
VRNGDVIPKCLFDLQSIIDPDNHARGPELTGITLGRMYVAPLGYSYRKLHTRPGRPAIAIEERKKGFDHTKQVVIQNTKASAEIESHCRAMYGRLIDSGPTSLRITLIPTR